MQHTTTQPRITAITQTHQSVFKRSTFVVTLAILGGITILTGIVSLISAINLLIYATMATLFWSIVADAICDFTVGMLIVAGSRAFAKGKILAIWLFGGSILLDSLYSLIRGYELHYIFVGLGFLLIWQMLKFKPQWETS